MSIAASEVAAELLGGRVRIGSVDWRVVADFDSAALADIGQFVETSVRIAPEDLLKQETRRLVFRHHRASSDLLVKAFPLHSIKKRLQHRKYADAEASNLARANQLRLPVPALYAFGRSTRFGLVSWNALITAYVDLPSLEQQMVAETDLQRRRQLIAGVYPFFRRLYETGCNHIDLKPGSFLTDTDGKGCIIDFQYVKFLPAPSPQVLAAQAGHFAWDVVSCNGWLTDDDLVDWFGGLLDYLGVAPDETVRQVFERTASRRYSIADRLQGTAGMVQ